MKATQKFQKPITAARSSRVPVEAGVYIRPNTADILVCLDDDSRHAQFRIEMSATECAALIQLLQAKLDRLNARIAA